MQAHKVVIVDLECLAQIALQRLLATKKKHPADAHETYFTANGENYRIRIERIQKEKSDEPVL